MLRAKERDYYENPKGRPPGFITVAQAARLAQCAQITIRRLIARRRLTVVRWRDRVLIREKDFAQWNRVRKYRRRPRTAESVAPSVARLGAANALDTPSETATDQPGMTGRPQSEAPRSVEVSS